MSILLKIFVNALIQWFVVLPVVPFSVSHPVRHLENWKACLFISLFLNVLEGGFNFFKLLKI